MTELNCCKALFSVISYGQHWPWCRGQDGGVHEVPVADQETNLKLSCFPSGRPELDALSTAGKDLLCF